MTKTISLAHVVIPEASKEVNSGDFEALFLAIIWITTTDNKLVKKKPFGSAQCPVTKIGKIIPL